MIKICVNKRYYTLEIIAEREGYVIYPKQRGNIISEGKTLEEAIIGIFDAIEKADKEIIL